MSRIPVNQWKGVARGAPSTISSVDRKGDGGNEARAVRSEKNHSFGNILRAPHHTHWRTSADPALVDLSLCYQLLGERRSDISRRDRIDANAMRPPFAAKNAGQHPNPCLGRAISGSHRQPENS